MVGNKQSIVGQPTGGARPSQVVTIDDDVLDAANRNSNISGAMEQVSDE